MGKRPCLYWCWTARSAHCGKAGIWLTENRGELGKSRMAGCGCLKELPSETALFQSCLSDSFPGYRAVQVLWLDTRRSHQNTAEWHLSGIDWMISVVIVYFRAATPFCWNMHLKYMDISSIIKYIKKRRSHEAPYLIVVVIIIVAVQMLFSYNCQKLILVNK